MELSPLDQIMPRFYIRIVLPIALPEPFLETAVEGLREGLQKIVEEIYFLGGNVIKSQRGPGLLDVSIEKMDWSTTWSTKDLRKAGRSWKLTMDNLQKSSFPMSVLDEDILVPVPALPDWSMPIKVLVAQANIVQGGILLCVAFHHSVFDATAISVILKRWASHCRRSSSEDPLEPGSLDRNVLIKDDVPPLPLSAFKEYTVMPLPETTTAGSEPPPTTAPCTLPEMPVSIFRFSAEALQNLKKDVTSRSDSVLSSNDCLCSLIWSNMTMARFPPSSSADETVPTQSTLGFAINGRSRTSPPLPGTYLGAHVVYGVTSALVSALREASSFRDDPKAPSSNPLQPLASGIRSAIAAITPDYTDRVIGLVKGLSDPSISLAATRPSPDPATAPLERFMPSFRIYMGPDVAISSWADTGLLGLQFFKSADFGSDLEEHGKIRRQVDESMGRVLAIRLPMTKMPAYDGLVIILPRATGDGEGGTSAQNSYLDVMIGLEKSAMERLKDAAARGEGLGRYGKWLCT